ncbi:MAG: hypothetical protein ACRDCW_14615 [Sarcina sp.]
MIENEIVTNYKSRFFSTEDLVSKPIFNRLGDEALKIIPAYALKTLDDLRINMKRAMIINSWAKSNVGFTQNGLICFDDPSYKRTVERTSFAYFNKKWFGLEWTIKFHGLSPDEVIRIIDLEQYPFIKSIRPATEAALENFVIVELKGNE